jgi:sulfatase modifying factor 1
MRNLVSHLLAFFFIWTPNCLAESAQEISSNKDSARMVFLKGGVFTLGSSKDEVRELVAKLKLPYRQNFDWELPVNVVSMPDLYMDKYEVTNEQYDKYVKDGNGRPSRLKKFPQFNRPLQPVVGVTWDDAFAYCRWAGRRLPTEQEWERAARGRNGATWPWGNAPVPQNFNGRLQGQYAAVNVGSFKRGDTPEGVADMAGNVWELTASPWGAGLHVMKGGSFLNDLNYVRGSVRWATHNEKKGANYLGFRCVANATGKSGM